MRRALMLAALLCGCLEVIEHAPSGSCEVDTDCACALDCNVVDGGFRYCGPHSSHTCTLDHDCISITHDAGSRCVAVSRDAGACGYSQCQ